MITVIYESAAMYELFAHGYTIKRITRSGKAQMVKAVTWN